MEITKKEIYVHTDIRTQKSSKNKRLNKNVAWSVQPFYWQANIRQANIHSVMNLELKSKNLKINILNVSRWKFGSRTDEWKGKEQNAEVLSKIKYMLTRNISCFVS